MNLCNDMVIPLIIRHYIVNIGREIKKWFKWEMFWYNHLSQIFNYTPSMFPNTWLYLLSVKDKHKRTEGADLPYQSNFYL